MLSHRAHHTEDDLLSAFPGAKNCDAGIDFGGDVLLVEVVSGTVTVPTREEANVTAFRADTERLVLKKSPPAKRDRSEPAHRSAACRLSCRRAGSKDLPDHRLRRPVPH